MAIPSNKTVRTLGAQRSESCTGRCPRCCPCSNRTPTEPNQVRDYRISYYAAGWRTIDVQLTPDEYNTAPVKDTRNPSDYRKQSARARIVRRAYGVDLYGMDTIIESLAVRRG